MLLAEAPVRGASVGALGLRVMGRVAELRLPLDRHGTVYSMPHLSQSNTRANDVL